MLSVREKEEQHRIRRTVFDNEREIDFRNEDKPKDPSVMPQNNKLRGQIRIKWFTNRSYIQFSSKLTY